MRRLGLPLCALLLLPRVVAQDEAGESAQARLLRDQARVGQRLTSLREKLERLAQRYTDEGRDRNAALLRDALTRFDEQKLLDVQRDVQRGLEQNSLSTVERQDALAAGLEAVYAILRDRRDVEELSRQTDLAREGLAQLSVLAENQRRLLASTRATTDSPKDLLNQALQRALDLANALSRAQEAAQLGADADRQMGESSLAAELAARQRELAAEAQPTSDTQAMLEQALALLRERLAQPGPKALEAGLSPELLAAAQSSRSLAEESAADAAAAMQAAREALDAAQRGEAAPPAAPRPGKPDGTSAGQPGEARPQGETPPGSQPQGNPPSGEPAQGAPSSESQPTGAPPAEQGASGAPPPAGESQPSAPQGSSGGQPQGQPGEKPQAGTPPAAPQHPEDSPAMAAARERMEQAAKNLDEVREDLERSERSLAAARNRARAAAQVESEQAAAGGKELDDLAQRLEAVEPQAGPEMLDRTRALLEELARLQAAVQAEQLDAAGQSAKQAQMSLDQLLESLRRRAADASDKPPEAPTQAKLDELAAQQAELQRQAAELMRRLSELPDQGFQEPAGRAQQAMQGAQSSLSRGDPKEGATREKEAAEELDKAAQQLSGEQNRYERLRQDEVLFRLNEDLTALLKRQQELSGQTRDLQEARGEEDRLSRSQRRAVGRMAEQERDLSAQSEAIRAALAQDEALAFEHALTQTRDDLSSIAEKLGDEQTGWTVQMLQGDVEQRISDLLAVLDAERQRRREALEKPEDNPQGQQPPGGQQGPEPLVPTVAELLLIQRLEQAALARLDAFSRTAAADKDGLDEGARDLLQRWASEHEKVTELFRQKFQGPGGQPEAPPPPAPEEGPR